MGCWGGRSFLLFTAKIMSDARRWGGYKPPHLFFFSTIPVFVIGCSTMAHPASCLRESLMHEGQPRGIRRRESASCPACHFRVIWYWGSTWWYTYQNKSWEYLLASLSMVSLWYWVSWGVACSVCSKRAHGDNKDFGSVWQWSSTTRMGLFADERTGTPFS